MMTTAPRKQNDLVLKWEKRTKVKCIYGMVRGAACVMGAVAYFNPGGTYSVYYFNCRKKQWGELPECHKSGSTMVVINDLLTTVGGSNSNKLFSFSDGGWEEKFPPMSTKRDYPAAVCTGRHVVVAGGHNDGEDLPTVEVMDTNTRQWSTAASLPRGITWASMTVCGDTLYLLGDDTPEVHYCSLQTLLQSCQAPGLSREASVWMRLQDLPVRQSTAATLCGELISVGGYDKDNQDVDSVYHYDSATSTWNVIGQMPSKNAGTLIATLPGDELIVVTGCKDISIDIASGVVLFVTVVR